MSYQIKIINPMFLYYFLEFLIKLENFPNLNNEEKNRNTSRLRLGLRKFIETLT
jgi:hypothetical protein